MTLEKLLREAVNELSDAKVELAKRDADTALAKYNEDTWYGRFMEAAQKAHDFQREKAVLTAERDALAANVKVLRDACETGLYAAREVAARVHLEMAGYKPDKHEAVDKDVADIEAALEQTK